MLAASSIPPPGSLASAHPPSANAPAQDPAAHQHPRQANGQPQPQDAADAHSTRSWSRARSCMSGLFDDDLCTVADRLEAVRAAGVARLLPKAYVVDLGSARQVAKGQ